MQYNLEISLEEAVKGTTVKIRVPTQVTCEACGGTGARKGSSPKTCPTCGGVGQVRMQQGFFIAQQTCPTCHGQGTVIDDPCTRCRGRGRVRDHKTLSVKVHVKKHPIFERDDADLRCEMPITITTAALGGELEVPTLEGKVKLKIPAGTQTGKVFRIRGKGVKPVRGGGVGDLLCQVVVETPVNLNDEQKELLQKLDESLQGGGSKHSPHSSSWLDGVKNFFKEMGF